MNKIKLISCKLCNLNNVFRNENMCKGVCFRLSPVGEWSNLVLVQESNGLRK